MYAFTAYFELEVLRKRPYLKKEWCIRVLENPIKVEMQAMMLQYYADIDSLYIDLSAKTSVESSEVSPGVVLDYDDHGNLVGIDIDNASSKLDLSQITLHKLPVLTEHLVA